MYRFVGAALAALDSGRLRVAAEACAQPRVRVAIEAAADAADDERLADALDDLALWPGETFDFAPMAFPVRIADRDAVTATLAQEAIWCPVHWSSLPSDPAVFPTAHRLAGEPAALALGQRLFTFPGGTELGPS